MIRSCSNLIWPASYQTQSNWDYILVAADGKADLQAQAGFGPVPFAFVDCPSQRKPPASIIRRGAYRKPFFTDWACHCFPGHSNSNNTGTATL